MLVTRTQLADVPATDGKGDVSRERWLPWSTLDRNHIPESNSGVGTAQFRFGSGTVRLPHEVGRRIRCVDEFSRRTAPPPVRYGLKIGGKKVSLGKECEN
jgi:hypothetical protein